MITIRKAEERGHFNHGWLDTFHTFSFADYYDPAHMGYRTLRVINEDTVQPGEGFGTHPHHDMEIVTYVTQGALEHKDSMGTGSVIRPGDVQRMTAGSGVTHSEFNHSEKEPVHLLQIWIKPDKTGLKPSYEQKRFDAATKSNRLCLIASQEGRDGSVTIHQDANLFASILERGQKLLLETRPDRGFWIQLVRGNFTLNGQVLKAGDGVSTDGREKIELEGLSETAEILVFDLK